ncbi:hypothetical protein Tco_1179321 [Tanacetum coccineum]
MFGNQFISVIEPDTKLGKVMVLHKDYLLGGSYHGNDSVFLLNCYGVRWQVEVKCLFSNMMSLVGLVWADFLMHNVTNDVTMLYFIEEVESRRAQTLPFQFEPNAYPTPKSDTVALFINDREYKVYLAKLSSVNALYCPELIIFGPGWSGMMDELAIQPDQFFAFTLVCKGGFNLTVFNKFKEALTVCENYATYMLRNASCHIGEEPDYDVERMGWFCNWRWHTTHADNHKAFYKKLTLELRKRTVSFEMFLTPTLRNMMDGSGFRAGQWVRFYLSEDTTLKDGVIRFEVC